MAPEFRKSMNLLHTWAGVLLGSVLFAVFWMGSLSVFDREIDRWMMPETRFSGMAPQPAGFFDHTLVPQAQNLSGDPRQWSVVFPTERAPLFMLTVRDASGASVSRYLHPASGVLLDDVGTQAGSGFIFPFHTNLHIAWKGIGYWLVGVAGMAMLLILVSGVIVHRRFFADFFTFRPRMQLRRSLLDLHNLTGVLGLPFHFIITLSGLVIFFAIYFPSVISVAYQGDTKTFGREALGDYRRAKAGKVSAGSHSIDAMVAEAQRLWALDGHAGVPRGLRVWHPGDANSVVEIRRAYLDRVAMTQETVYFDAATGEILHRERAKPVRTAQRFISGLHFIQFEHWTLRWFYFLAGLLGCAMIATGMLFWIESRRAVHAARGIAGARVVEGLTVGSVTGIIVATLAFFIANRLLPSDWQLAGIGRAGLEICVFYLVWIATFVQAWRCGYRSWLMQTWIIAVLALIAVVLNGLTTGDHPYRAFDRALWGVAGMDVLLLLTAAIAILCAWRLRGGGRG